MIRSVSAVAAGYITIVLLDLLFRLAAARLTGFAPALTGIGDLPSTGWQYASTGILIVYGMAGGMVTSSVVRTSADMEILSLILLAIFVGFVNFRVLAEIEPIWYLTVSPLLKTGGIFLGFRINKFMKRTSNEDSDYKA